MFQSIYENPTGITWDYQWTFTCFMQSALTIIPNVNLISNIGVGADSTHFTSGQDFSYINMATEAMQFPLKHPSFITRNTQADNFVQDTVYGETTLQIFKQKLKEVLKSLNIKPMKKVESSLNLNHR